MTPEERKFVLGWIKDQLEAQQRAIEEAKQKSRR